MPTQLDNPTALADGIISDDNLLKVATIGGVKQWIVNAAATASPTKTEAVETSIQTQASLAALPTDAYQISDEVILSDGPNAGRRHRLIATPANVETNWEVADASQPRIYPTEADRTNRSTFIPIGTANKPEFVFVDSTNVTYKITDPANATSDEPVSGAVDTSILIVNHGAVATFDDAGFAAKFANANDAKPLDQIQVGTAQYQMKLGATDAQVALSWEPIDGSIRLGRGTALPADNTDYDVFVLSGSTTIPNAEYTWSQSASQWVEGTEVELPNSTVQSDTEIVGAWQYENTEATPGQFVWVKFLHIPIDPNARAIRTLDTFSFTTVKGVGNGYSSFSNFSLFDYDGNQYNSSLFERTSGGQTLNNWSSNAFATFEWRYTGTASLNGVSAFRAAGRADWPTSSYSKITFNFTDGTQTVYYAGNSGNHQGAVTKSLSPALIFRGNVSITVDPTKAYVATAKNFTDLRVESIAAVPAPDWLQADPERAILIASSSQTETYSQILSAMEDVVSPAATTLQITQTDGTVITYNGTGPDDILTSVVGTSFAVKGLTPGILHLIAYTGELSDELPTIQHLYANEVDRLAQTGYTVNQADIDLRRIFEQQDTGELYRPLGSPATLTWERVGGGSEPPLLPTIQAAINQNVTIPSATPPSFIHLNGGVDAANSNADWITDWDVSTAGDGQWMKVKAFARDQLLTITGATAIIDGDTPTVSPISIRAGETVSIHHTLNAGQRFVNIDRRGGVATGGKTYTAKANTIALSLAEALDTQLVSAWLLESPENTLLSYSNGTETYATAQAILGQTDLYGKDLGEATAQAKVGSTIIPAGFYAINVETGPVAGFYVRQISGTYATNVFGADLLDTQTLDQPNSTTTPTSTNFLIPDWSLRLARGNFTAPAQSNNYLITEDGTIEVVIPKADITTTPVTIQLSETATPSNQFSTNIAADGTLSQPIGDPTNELSGIVATRLDNDDYWLLQLSGVRPTDVILKFWGNDIGDPGDFTDYRYGFRLVSPSNVVTYEITTNGGADVLGSAEINHWIQIAVTVPNGQYLSGLTVPSGIVSRIINKYEGVALVLGTTNADVTPIFAPASLTHIDYDIGAVSAWLRTNDPSDAYGQLWGDVASRTYNVAANPKYATFMGLIQVGDIPPGIAVDNGNQTFTLQDWSGVYIGGSHGTHDVGDFEDYLTARPRTANFTTTSNGGGTGDTYRLSTAAAAGLGGGNVTASGNHTHSINGGGDSRTQPPTRYARWVVKLVGTPTELAAGSTLTITQDYSQVPIDITANGVALPAKAVLESTRIIEIPLSAATQEIAGTVAATNSTSPTAEIISRGQNGFAYVAVQGTGVGAIALTFTEQAQKFQILSNGVAIPGVFLTADSDAVVRVPIATVGKGMVLDAASLAAEIHLLYPGIGGQKDAVVSIPRTLATANVDVTWTEGNVLETNTGLQHVAVVDADGSSWLDPNQRFAQNATVSKVIGDLTTIDTLQFGFSDDSGNHLATADCPVRHEGGGAYSLAHWHGTQYLRVYFDDIATGAIRLIAIDGTRRVKKVRYLAYAANGYVIPTGYDPIAKQTITVNGATPISGDVGFIDRMLPIRFALPNNQQVDQATVAATNGAVIGEIIPGDGTSDGIIYVEPKATGPIDVTFTTKQSGTGQISDVRVGFYEPTPGTHFRLGDPGGGAIDIETGINFTLCDEIRISVCRNSDGDLNQVSSAPVRYDAASLNNIDAMSFMWADGSRRGDGYFKSLANAQAGIITFDDHVEATGAYWIAGYKMGPIGYAVPTGTRAITPHTITVNGAAPLSGSPQFSDVGGGLVRYMPPAGKQIDQASVGQTGTGTAALRHPGLGGIVAAEFWVDPTSDLDITFTEIDYVQGAVSLQPIAEATGLSLDLDTNPTIDFGVTLIEGDLIVLAHRYATDGEGSTHIVEAQAGKSKRFTPYPTTSELTRIQFPATLNTTAQFFDAGGNTNSTLLSWKIYRNQPGAYVVPEATTASIPVTMSVTLDGAAATITRSGADTATAYELVKEEFQIQLGTDKILLSAAATPSTVQVSITDIEQGFFKIFVPVGTGNFAIAATSGDRNSHKVLVATADNVNPGGSIPLATGTMGDLFGRMVGGEYQSGQYQGLWCHYFEGEADRRCETQYIDAEEWVKHGYGQIYLGGHSTEYIILHDVEEGDTQWTTGQTGTPNSDVRIFGIRNNIALPQNYLAPAVRRITLATAGNITAFANGQNYVDVLEGHAPLVRVTLPAGQILDPAITDLPTTSGSAILENSYKGEISIRVGAADGEITLNSIPRPTDPTLAGEMGRILALAKVDRTVAQDSGEFPIDNYYARVFYVPRSAYSSTAFPIPAGDVFSIHGVGFYGSQSQPVPNRYLTFIFTGTSFSVSQASGYNLSDGCLVGIKYNK